MRRPIRYYRVSITVPQNLMETLFDLLKDEDAHDFRMMELGPDGQVPKPMQAASQPIVNPVNSGHTRNRENRTYERSTRWMDKHWPNIEPTFKALNGGSINYKDMRLVQAIAACGMSPSSVSTIMSSLTRYGKIVRSGHGEYKLP